MKEEPKLTGIAIGYDAHSCGTGIPARKNVPITHMKYAVSFVVIETASLSYFLVAAILH